VSVSSLVLIVRRPILSQPYSVVARENNLDTQDREFQHNILMGSVQASYNVSPRWEISTIKIRSSFLIPQDEPTRVLLPLSRFFEDKLILCSRSAWIILSDAKTSSYSAFAGKNKAHEAFGMIFIIRPKHALISLGM